MAGIINKGRLKQAADELSRHVSFTFPPTCFYYTAAAPANSAVPAAGKWTCVFSLMPHVKKGDPAVFTAARPGCFGALGYFGFKEIPAVAASMYLSGRERLKKDAGLAASFYRQINAVPATEANLVFQRLDLLPDGVQAEVINLWLDPTSLSQMHTLANYDRADNNNVIMPFASGCQSIFTIPFQEGQNGKPRAVAGSLDPTVRRYLSADTLSFSLPAGRFVEMCENIAGSFLSR